MSDISKNRSRAMKWMMERRQHVVWWRWSVLTDKNPDPTSLRIKELDAFLIFSDLVQRGLLLPVVADDGSEAYSINSARIADWSEEYSPLFALIGFIRRRVVDWLIGGVIGAFIGKAMFGQ